MIETERLILRELDEEDFSAVHAYGSDPEVVEYLLGAGCDATATDSTGCTGLMLAVATNEYDSTCSGASARVLLKHSATNLEATDNAGCTAYLHACAAGTDGALECVQVLLDAGCNPAKTDARGMTALMLAAECGEIGDSDEVDGSRNSNENESVLRFLLECYLGRNMLSVGAFMVYLTKINCWKTLKSASYS